MCCMCCLHEELSSVDTNANGNVMRVAIVADRHKAAAEH
jgi:hypothetical protein